MGTCLNVGRRGTIPTVRSLGRGYRHIVVRSRYRPNLPFARQTSQWSWGRCVTPDTSSALPKSEGHQAVPRYVESFKIPHMSLNNASLTSYEHESNKQNTSASLVSTPSRIHLRNSTAKEAAEAFMKFVEQKLNIGLGSEIHKFRSIVMSTLVETLVDFEKRKAESKYIAPTTISDFVFVDYTDRNEPRRSNDISLLRHVIPQSALGYRNPTKIDTVQCRGLQPQSHPYTTSASPPRKNSSDSNPNGTSFEIPPENRAVPLTYEDPYKKQHDDLLDIVKHRMEERKQMVDSKGVVTLAITSNLIMMCGKMYAAYQSGSASMFSEALHSVADILNESLLMLGISRSLREPDELHPYGYVQERYAWALVSGVGIFFLGGGASIYRGISGILQGSAEISDPSSAYIVLSASLLFEVITLRYAYRHIRNTAEAQGLSFKDYFFKGADPTAVQVFTEDCASVVGIAVAGACVTLASILKMPILDSIGSLVIGSILICVAGFLIRRNISGLVETSMHASKLQEIVSLLEYDPVVKSVHAVKSLSVSPEESRFKADIVFDGAEITKRYIKNQGEDFERDIAALGRMKSDKEREEWFVKHGGKVVESVGEEVDRLESIIRSKRPEVKYIDLESS